MIDLKRLDGENEEQFIFRLGQAKDSGQLDMSWDEIADVINKEFRESEDEYRTEAAYRKPYQQAKRYFESGCFNTKCSPDSYSAEIRLQKQELQKEKQKLFDERTAMRKILREDARGEENFMILENLIKQNGQIVFPPVYPEIDDTHNTLFVCLSDMHMGMTFDNSFGKYNSDIAYERLQKYLDEILKLQVIYNASNVVCCLLGDEIQGNIHLTTQLESRENVVEQVQLASEYISAFVYELSKHFKNVDVNGVAGNHSRLSLKDAVLRGERLDDLVLWYMKAKLDHIDNISFIDEFNIDSTIATCFVDGKEYWLCHGDFDSYSENGIQKLVMMNKVIPEGIFFGHLHHNSYDNISGVKIIRSGSFCGCGDDYTVSKRICGEPEQVVCVMDKTGIKAFCPITLK